MSFLVESRFGVHLVNEDRYICEPDVPFYAVLDGEVHEGYAADVALATLRAELERIRQALDEGLEQVSRALVQAVKNAHLAVFDVSVTPAKRGCGTTLTCCVVSGQELVVAHVGDSRLYCHDSDGWRRVTTDHTLLEDKRKAGVHVDLTEESTSFDAGVITRILGISPDVEVDVYRVLVSSGAQVLLCTDGAWRPFDPQFIGAPPPDLTEQSLLDWIVREYEGDGQRDNATMLWATLPPVL